MKEINLEKILYSFVGEDGMDDNSLKAMREACNQAIELCAENAEIHWGGKELKTSWEDSVWVNRYSILKVKEEIK